MIFLLCTSFTLYYPNTQATDTYEMKFSQKLQTKIKEPLSVEENDDQEQSGIDRIVASLPYNLIHRFYYWEFYGKAILESPKVFFLGHQARPDRNKYPSAHNYYLDLIYHFGVMAMLPIIYLISVTVRNCWRVIRTGALTPSLTMLMFLVGFFVFADNFLKGSFRQPYPGIVMFFLWGVLVMKTSITKGNRD